MKRSSINLLLFLCLLSHTLSCDRKANEAPKPAPPGEIVTADVCRVMSKVWRNDEFTSEDYVLAVHKMLRHAEVLQSEWLTLGNVIKFLGTPDSITTDFEYTFDEHGNVMEDVTHVQIAYAENGVLVGFACTGFIISVTAKVGPEKESGLGSFSWPQQIPDQTKTPVLTGTFESSEVAKELIDTADSIVQGNSREVDWYRLIVGLDYPLTSKHEKTYRYPCDARIVLADGISDSIARVHYRTKGLHKLHYQTWWLRANGRWERITSSEAKEMLNSLWRADQK